MGLTNEQLVESAFIEAFSGQSSAMKNLYRFELEAWIDDVMTMVAREVAASKTYALLQRTVQLPVKSSAAIPYSVFGQNLEGDTPSIDNGIIKGDGSTYALSANRLPLSGSPLRVRDYFTEWQLLLPSKTSGPGVISPFIESPDPSNINNWDVLLRTSLALATGSVFVRGVSYVDVFPAVERGDIFRFEWDTNGDLVISQYTDQHVFKMSFNVTAGEITASSVPGVYFGATGGQVGVGQMGPTVITPGPTGVYQISDLTQYQVLGSSLPNSGLVRFDTGKSLSFVPSLAYRSIVERGDTWYWTFEGENILFWFGKSDETPALPSENMLVTANIIPTAPDLPFEWHQRAVDLLVEKARQRAAMNKIAINK